jgi:hypothetical protein
MPPKKNYKFLFWFRWFFHWKNCSIFNNFLTLGWNIMKPTPCTPTHWGLSNLTRMQEWFGRWGGNSKLRINKLNKIKTTHCTWAGLLARCLIIIIFYHLISAVNNNNNNNNNLILGTILNNEASVLAWKFLLDFWGR